MTGKVLVIGAGLGGLTAALALRQAGLAVEVHEAAAGLGEVGAGLTPSRGAQSLFRHLGVQDRIACFATRSTGFPFLHYRTGALLAGALDREGLPDDGVAEMSRQCHRADLHAVLAEAVGDIRLGHRLVDIEETSTVVRARFADGSVAGGDALVAADGARSVARSLLWGDDAPRFTGQVAYRFLIDRAEAAPFVEHGRGAVFPRAGRDLQPLYVAVGRIAQLRRYCRERGMDGRKLLHRRDAPRAARDLRRLASVGHGLMGCADRAIKWGIFDRAPMPRWSEGGAALLGDAAHAMPPFLGRCCNGDRGRDDPRPHLRPESSTEAAFARYEAARIRRTALVHARSVEQGRPTQARDPDRYSHVASPAADPEILGYDPVTAPI